MNNRIFTDKNLGSTFEYVDLFIMAILMFYEYNLSIIDKANRIDEKYAANKFSDKRIINETGVGFKIMIIGIV